MWRKLRAVLIVVLACFLLVTSYFYAVHNNCVYRTRVDIKPALEGVPILKITDITLQNKLPKEPGMEQDSDPLYYRVLKVLPARFHRPFLSAVFFYHNPYEMKPGVGLLEINGLSVGLWEPMLGHEARFLVYLNDRTANGATWEGATDSNFGTFQMRFENMPLDIDKLELRFFDTERGVDVFKTVIETAWETEHYFFRKPLKPSVTSVSLSLARRYGNGELDEARQLVLPELRQSFPWERLDYLKTTEYGELLPGTGGPYYHGDYMGFSDVFTSRLTWGEYDREDGAYRPLAEQYVYLVERGGEWKIIDVSPLARPLPNPGST